MEKEFKTLDWDSNFFNFPVARIENNILSKDNYLKILDGLYAENIQLAYYFSKIPFLENAGNSLYDICPIFKKIPIIKPIREVSKLNCNISLYTEEYPEEDLIILAQLAGKQGRFGRDQKIPDSKCDELFKHWIINSVNKSIADEVYVYREGKNIIGFATIKIVGNKGYAPLFAVNRSFEGKGVSFALMRAVETRLFECGCEYVISETQDLNKKALAIFKRFGLEFQAPEYVYHLWKKN